MEMSHRRVVITGMGALAPNGTGVDEFWNGLVSGKSGINLITSFDSKSFPSRIAGEISGFDPLRYMNRKCARRTARFAQLAVAAAVMAASDAGLSGGKTVTGRTAAFIGTASGAMDVLEKEHKKLCGSGIKRLSPFGAASYFPNSAAAEVAIALGFTGRVITISTGCTCGLDAVGAAFEEISSGGADMAVCGGADASVTPLTLGSFCAANILSLANEYPERASRPFDAGRDGGVLSEGAGMLILEDEEHAAWRGARVYGLVSGFGTSSRASSVFEDDSRGEGFAREILNALSGAEMDPRDIDYVCAHAPSDVVRDAAETSALKAVFGERAYRLPVSSIKSMIGNPLASAGPLQAIASVMAVNSSTVPPTLNYERRDPSCDLDYVPNRARRNIVRNALINSHGFGGSNASLIVSEYPGGKPCR